MPSRKKPTSGAPASSSKSTKSAQSASDTAQAKNTMGGPSSPSVIDGKAPTAKTSKGKQFDAPGRNAARETLLADKIAGTEELSAAIRYNENKAAEHGHDGAIAPPEGVTAEPPLPSVTGSTISETDASEKAGSGTPPQGVNPGNAPLDRVRVDSGGRMLTTNQGVAIADNQNSLKAGLRGPTLLQDFVLREKITHFDHERIPERIVHARGSAAHGFFECYEPLTQYTKAAPFAEKGKLTPVFARFSTVVGERGSTDLARDVRGFAVKFYTEEGI